MATPTPTVTDLGTDAVLVTWALTTADHTGAAIGPEITSQYKNVTWHSNGTWGGATAAAEGSNTNTAAHFGAIKNADGGAAITYTADAGSPATQAATPAYLRARLSTVGAGAAVNVVAYCSKVQKTTKAH
jgi:hypothetical protein